MVLLTLSIRQITVLSCQIYLFVKLLAGTFAYMEEEVQMKENLLLLMMAKPQRSRLSLSLNFSMDIRLLKHYI